MLLLIKIAFTLMIVGVIGAAATQSSKGKIIIVWWSFILMLMVGFLGSVAIGLKWMWFDCNL